MLPLTPRCGSCGGINSDLFRFFFGASNPVTSIRLACLGWMELPSSRPPADGCGLVRSSASRFNPIRPSGNTSGARLSLARTRSATTQSNLEPAHLTETERYRNPSLPWPISPPRNIVPRKRGNAIESLGWFLWKHYLEYTPELK